MLPRSPLLGLLRTSSRFGINTNMNANTSRIFINKSTPLPTTSSSFPRPRYFSSSRRVRTPYEVLGVAPNATEKDIKVAYFREAKKWHPDMNPGDATAKAKFQELAAAYELLRDSSRRRQYDASASASSGSAQQDWQNNSAAQNMNASDVFNSLYDDAEVIKDALKMYVSDIQEDFSTAVSAAGRQDWPQVWEIAKSNKGIIFGIVMPTLLFFRFPAAVFAVGRVAVFVAEGIISTLLIQGQMAKAMTWLWRRIVSHARDKKNRGRRA